LVQTVATDDEDFAIGCLLRREFEWEPHPFNLLLYELASRVEVHDVHILRVWHHKVNRRFTDALISLKLRRLLLKKVTFVFPLIATLAQAQVVFSGVRLRVLLDIGAHTGHLWVVLVIILHSHLGILFLLVGCLDLLVKSTHFRDQSVRELVRLRRQWLLNLRLDLLVDIFEVLAEDAL